VFFEHNSIMGTEEESIPIVQVSPVAAGERTSLLGVVVEGTGDNNGNADGASAGSDDHRRTTSWKDGLFSCCKFGPCHPSLLNACCCPQILMAQVLTRMRLDMLGDPAPEHVYKSTFKKVVLLVIAYYAYFFIFGCPSAGVVGESEDDGLVHEVDILDCPPWQRSLGHVVSMVFGLYTLVVMIKVRAAVRDHFGIPSQTCFGEFMEDCCCVFWCGCCTVSQLARQTADYDVYNAKCCSPTGLPMRGGGVVSNSVIIV
jgi:Cys-rich protein (TIGR01571 family)